MNLGNIFSNIPENLSEELFEDIVGKGSVKIERIVSTGHASPQGFWYDQERSEWVIVIRGSAGLRFEGTPDVVVLKSGDYVDIPAHRRHRVEWTDPNERTIWIAVHH